MLVQMIFNNHCVGTSLSEIILTEELTIGNKGKPLLKY